MTGPELRRLPAPAVARTSCQGCRQPIVWAVTVAGPNGPGGKLMPLEPVEDLEGNVAVTTPHPPYGRLLARVLGKDEIVDRPVEYAAMTHFATCPTRTRPELPPEVIDLQEQRTKRRRGGRR